MVVNGLSPILAPVFGGFLLNFTDWHGIFVTLLVIGILLFAVNLRISESLLKHRRIQRQRLGHVPSFRSDPQTPPVHVLRADAGFRDGRIFHLHRLVAVYPATALRPQPDRIQRLLRYQRSGHHRRQLAGRPVPQGKQRAVGRPVGPGRFRRPVRDDPAVRTSVRIPGVHAFSC